MRMSVIGWGKQPEPLQEDTSDRAAGPPPRWGERSRAGAGSARASRTQIKDGNKALSQTYKHQQEARSRKNRGNNA